MIEALRTAISGIQKSSLNVAKAAGNIANPNRVSDIHTDIVDLKINEQHYKANALVIEQSKELQETLFRAIDIEV